MLLIKSFFAYLLPAFSILLNCIIFSILIIKFIPTHSAFVKNKYINSITLFGNFYLQRFCFIIKTKKILISIFICIFMNAFFIFIFMNKKNYETNINYFLLFLAKTESSPKLIGYPMLFPSGIYKAFQVSLASTISFVFQIYTLAFFLLSRSSVKFSNDIYAALRIITDPIKNKTENINFLRIFKEENLDAIFQISIISIILLLIISFQFNFHNLINLFFAALYNYIEIGFIIAFIIFIHSFFIIVKSEKFLFLQNFCEEFSQPFLKPIRELFAFHAGKYDFIPLLSSLFIYIVYSFFSLIILELFHSFNIAF